MTKTEILNLLIDDLTNRQCVSIIHAFPFVRFDVNGEQIGIYRRWFIEHTMSTSKSLANKPKYAYLSLNLLQFNPATNEYVGEATVMDNMKGINAGLPQLLEDKLGTDIHDYWYMDIIS